MANQHYGTFLLLQAIRGVGWWRRLDFTPKLAGAATLGIIAVMVAIGCLLARQIEDHIVHKAAVGAALYIGSVIEPHVQSLAYQTSLSPEKEQELEKLFSAAGIRRPVLSFRIWVGDQIIFSKEPGLVGKHFPPNDNRSKAWDGQVSANLDADGDDEIQVRALNTPILEVYAPIRQAGTGRIIAVSETYEAALTLKKEIWHSWFVICTVFSCVTVLVIYLMFSLVGRGARQLSRMSASNRRISEFNERQMWRMSTDLYDGPVQLVSIALLKFDSLREMIGDINTGTPAQKRDLETIHRALNDALSEIRGYSRRLLPSQITHMPLSDTIRMAARKSEFRSGEPVRCDIGQITDEIPFALKACLYRFVEEGLNLFRHGYGGGPSVCASGDGGHVEVEIFGTLLDSEQQPVPAQRQKLQCHQDRVEALGGVFLIHPYAEKTSLVARFGILQTE